MRKKILNKYLSRFKVDFLKKNWPFLLTVMLSKYHCCYHYKTGLIFFFILSKGFLNLIITDILGQINLCGRESFLYVVGWLPTSLASTHETPVTLTSPTPSCDNQNVTKYPLVGKNHLQLRTTVLS